MQRYNEMYVHIEYLLGKRNRLAYRARQMPLDSRRHARHSLQVSVVKMIAYDATGRKFVNRCGGVRAASQQLFKAGTHILPWL